ncbi:MAG TPA: hypothetical protein VNV82_13255 [Bryobacteraceae bacterium]|jgi:hypothetical protein|nr:hypothetical protein [Bryobacteraceae bacterium]
MIAVRLFLAFVLICVLGPAAKAQDRHDWQSLAQLHPGDNIRLSLKTGPVDGTFQDWTPRQVTAGTVTARREDVLEIDRYRRGGLTRGKRAAVGAVIGFGGGFAIGAAVGGCHQGQFGPCISRGALGAGVGAAGAVIGAGIAALLPRHTTELIYSAR